VLVLHKYIFIYRSCRQISTATQTSVAEEHLGRRGDDLLLQGEVAPGPEGLLPAKLLPDAGGEAKSGEEDRSDVDSGQQLVQEQTSAGPSAEPERRVLRTLKTVRLYM